MIAKQIFVERRPQGDYAVRRANSERASDVLPTQAEAIKRARELGNGVAPLVERVRNTAGGKPDKWRAATSDKKVFVEKRPEGDYAVRRSNSPRASDVLPTQAEAIERARELIRKPGASVITSLASNSKKSRDFLQSAGILTPTGRLSPKYKK